MTAGPLAAGGAQVPEDQATREALLRRALHLMRCGVRPSLSEWAQGMVLE